MSFGLTVLLSLVVIFLVRPITVLFHELGHGIPALLLTDDKVTLYIGSYGDQEHSYHFRFGRLDIFFKYQIFRWDTGLCVPHAKQVDWNHQFLIILGGPMLSFVLFILFGYSFWHGSIPWLLDSAVLILVLSAGIDFFYSIIPNQKTIELADGRVTYNDGRLLLSLWESRAFPPEYATAVELYTKEQFAESAKLFKKIIEEGHQHEQLYRLALSALLQKKDYTNARPLQEAFEAFGKLLPNDYSNAGLIYSELGDHDKAMEYYQQALALEPANKYALANQGYTLLVKEDFAAAVNAFNKAIEAHPDFAYNYSNRGWAKIQLGQEEEGVQDIEKAIEKDPEEPYAHRNLGIYYFKQENYKQAVEHLEKAFSKDPQLDQVEDYLKKAKTQYESSQI